MAIAPQTAPLSQGTSPQAQGNYWPALMLLASVFLMWGFATVLNDILVPHLKAVFTLNYGQALLVQFVFFMAYFTMSVPSAFVIKRIGYKMSLVLGLCVAGFSCLLFIPSAQFVSFPFFLGALFVMGSSFALLQTAANPYVTVIGPPESASSRLNLVQAFNSMGTVFAPMFGSILIFGRSTTGGEGAGEVVMTAAEKLENARAVELPYAIIAAIFISVALLVARAKLPDIGAHAVTKSGGTVKGSLWGHRNLVFGVPAIFIYLIAEIGIASTLVNFMGLPHIGGLTHEQAGKLLTFFWAGMMVGRFAGSMLMRIVKPETLLAACGLGAFILCVTAVFGSGPLAMWALIGTGLFMSIMFPTIFALGVRDMGDRTEEASGLLIMAIAGGALAALQGVIADATNSLQLSYLLPAVCYIYVVFYALWGCKSKA